MSHADRQTMIAPEPPSTPDAQPAPEVPEAGPKPRVRLDGVLLWGIELLLLTGFVLAAWLPQDLRETNRWIVRFFLALFFLETFRFHVGVGLLVLVLFAVLRRFRRAAVGLALLSLYALVPTVRDFAGKSHVPTSGPEISLMCINLLHTNLQRGGILDEIDAGDPDVLVLQEYHERWDTDLMPRIRDRYPHRITISRRDAFGLALFSKLPFHGEPRSDLWLGLEVPQLRVELEVGERIVALYNLHLMPPMSARRAIEQRTGLAALLDYLAEEDLPAIVCGDFNMTDDSYYARQLHAAGYRDTHTLIGWGRAATWPNLGPLRYLPGVRIDHIYVSEELLCTESGRGEGQGSDHLPISATVAFR